MKTWVLPASPVSPFPETPGDVPWLRSTLRAGRRERLAQAGCVLAEGEPPQSGPALVVGDELACNAELLRTVLAQVPDGRRVVLGASEWSAFVGASGDLALPLWKIGAGAVPDSREALDALPSYVIDPQIQPFPFESAFEVGVPKRFGLPVGDWSRVLWANLFGLAAEFAGATRASGLWFVLRTLFKARSLSRARILAAASVIERGAQVHPSAVVEASYIGPGAVVGPNAVVRGSILGPKAHAEALTDVTGSILGEGARAQRQAMVRFSVLWPEAFVGGTVQLSVFGRASRFHGGSYAMDMNLDATPVTIRTADGLVEAGTALGGCLGHEAVVGSGVWLAPGRVVPSGVTVIRDPARIVRRVPAPGDLDAGVVMHVRDGKLVPVESA